MCEWWSARVSAAQKMQVLCLEKLVPLVKKQQNFSTHMPIDISNLNDCTAWRAALCARVWYVYDVDLLSRSPLLQNQLSVTMLMASCVDKHFRYL